MKPAFELTWSTPPAWAEAVLEQPLALLSDHAHCELGAAAAAQGLVARRPENPRLVERLAAHAIEELRHFRQVHRLLIELGGRLEPVRKNAYAIALMERVERGIPGTLDRLLVAAVIERRSLERFELLQVAAAERGSPLAGLFAELAPSEAGHAALFVELARGVEAPEVVARRLDLWLEREAEIIRGLPFEVRIHSGPPPVPAARGVEKPLRS